MSSVPSPACASMSAAVVRRPRIRRPLSRPWAPVWARAAVPPPRPVACGAPAPSSLRHHIRAPLRRRDVPLRILPANIDRSGTSTGSGTDSGGEQVWTTAAQIVEVAGRPGVGTEGLLEYRGRRLELRPSHFILQPKMHVLRLEKEREFFQLNYPRYRLIVLRVSSRPPVLQRAQDDFRPGAARRSRR